MVSSFQALAVAIVALLPGALYIWSFERQVGRWGIGLSDRLLRFVGVSALFHAVVAPLTYWFWATHWSTVRAGDPLSRWFWLVPVGYIGVPIALGSLVGRGVRGGWRWTQLVTGPTPAPRAWDELFQGNPSGWVRLRLKSGTWIGGAFTLTAGRRSYVAGYPETQDLLLSQAAVVDPQTGEFKGVAPTAEGQAIRLLVRWEEVEYLEFVEDVDANGKDVADGEEGSPVES